MKRLIIVILLSMIMGSLAFAEPMNIVFILADDLGWADTTLYGHTTFYETPNLERLARRGMTFSRAYSNSPLCSPTRASILTGQTPARHGSTAPQHHTQAVRMQASVAKSAPAGNKALQTQSVTRLDTKLPTLAKRLKTKGYATGHFGKWHLGPEPFSPLEHGFDVDVPHWPGPGPAGSFVAPWKYKNFKENEPQEHIEDRMAAEAVKWMETVKDQPFYMNYWQFSVHAPFDAKEDLIAKYRQEVDPADEQRCPTYAAMVESLDDAVGTLLDAVDRLGMAERTAFVFISDNGGNMYNLVENERPTSNRPLRGGKATMFEGGIRVPCIVSWPGVTKPDTLSQEIIQTSDFYPTILKQLGIPSPANHVVDGVDLSEALRGETLEREAIFTFFPHSPGVPDWLPPAMSVHQGDWKLIRLFHQGEDGAHDYLLYNLAQDLGEQNNLAQLFPEMVVHLDNLIEGHINATNAVVPQPNPKFDKQKYHPEDVGVPSKKFQKKVVVDALYEVFQNPPAEARPFVRWWWNDNRIEAKEIIRELDIMQKAGIGGFEINPIALHDQLPRSGTPLRWLSPEWNEMVKVAVEEAKQRGMIADLIVGTGWPFGGEFLKSGQLNQALELHHRVIVGPKVLTLSRKELLAPTRKHWQARGGHGREPELRFLQLVPQEIRDIKEVQNLQLTFDDQDQITINIPAGKHVLYTGTWKEGYRTVVGGAAGGAGPVMDHFDRDVVNMYLKKMSQALAPIMGGEQGIRAMFCDSIELAGANWSDDMLKQFRQRRGYDIDPYLPFVIVNESKVPDNTLHPAFQDTIYRVRYDFSLNLVEMFLERFTQTFHDWCHEYGMLSRYQAYGTPWLMGLSEGYLIPDIPESNNWLFSRNPYHHGYWVWHKYCSSSGHLTGRSIISNESMTNTRGVFQATLEMFKQADDMNFIQGMTHSVLHGFNYSPPEAGFPGWIRYGAYLNEHNTWWPSFRTWADYNARLSAVFQKAKPKGQCAILAPAADLWSEFSLIRGKYHVTPWYCHELWEPLQQSGYAADYLSEMVIQKARMTAGRLVHGPMDYEVLILADVKSMQPKTAQAIKRFVNAGGKLLVIGETPQRSPSLWQAQENDRQVKAVFASIMQPSNAEVLHIPAPKPETDLLPIMQLALSELTVKPHVRITQAHPQVYQILYEYQGRPILFLANHDDKQLARIQAKLSRKGQSLCRWDPETGERQAFDAAEEITLAPLESLLLVYEDTPPGQAKQEQIWARTPNMTIATPWEVTLQPAIEASSSHTIDTLVDLGLSDIPMFNQFAGTATYTTRFTSTNADNQFINLGTVHGISTVKLNGQKLGQRWWGEHVYDVRGLLKAGENTLEIKVVTVLSNYCRMLKDNPSAMRWSRGHKPVSTGLVGPVTLHSVADH